MQKKSLKKNILISDVTLRDGNHAISHQIPSEVLIKYCKSASDSGLKIIEVGHGNGLGASSISIGFSKIKTNLALKLAKKNIGKAELSIHSIPGFSTLEDLNMAISNGVDIFRIGTNSPDVDIAFQQIEYCQKKKKKVWGILMMSHLVFNNEEYIKKVRMLVNEGVKTVVIMDSAGFFLPNNVSKIFKNLQSEFKNIKFGFHGHNNLGCAIWNSIEAVKNGCVILDASIRGFGAGAGNTQLEILSTVLEKIGYKTNISQEKLFNLSDNFTKMFKKIKIKNCFTNPSNILSAKYGLFSGFAPKVDAYAKKYKIKRIESFKEIGKKKLVAGQEDLIPDILAKIK